MTNDDSILNEFGETYEKTVLNKIQELIRKQTKIIEQLEEIRKYVHIEKEIPNIVITLNNKLIEVEKQFKEAGLSMYCQRYSDSRVVPSLVGDAVIEDMVNYTLRANEDISQCKKKYLETYKKKATGLLAIEKMNPLKKFFLELRNYFKFVRNNDSLFTEEETDEINRYLLEYIDEDNELWNYNLKDNIVRSIVNEIKEQKISASTVPGVVKEIIAPDIIKLGYGELIPKIEEALIEEYKKNVKSPEEDNCLNVPEFIDNNTEKTNDYNEQQDKWEDDGIDI